MIELDIRNVFGDATSANDFAEDGDEQTRILESLRPIVGAC
jgi:hypothetical protein